MDVSHYPGSLSSAVTYVLARATAVLVTGEQLERLAQLGGPEVPVFGEAQSGRRFYFDANARILDERTGEPFRVDPAAEYWLNRSSGTDVSSGSGPKA